MSRLTEGAAWKALQRHLEVIKDMSMRDMFEKDGDRINKFSSRMDDILLDFSKNRIND